VTKQLSMTSNEAGTTTALTAALNVSNIVSCVRKTLKLVLAVDG
jgi:hypothetical protein